MVLSSKIFRKKVTDYYILKQCLQVILQTHNLSQKIIIPLLHIVSN